MKYSIIIPSYNQPQLLVRSLIGLSRLDYPCQEFEVLIVDDGGTVAVADIADAFSKKLVIRVLRQAHGGQALAKKTGACAAIGKHLLFLTEGQMARKDWLSDLDKNQDSMAATKKPQRPLQQGYFAGQAVKPLISVVIPTYKRAELVVRAVRSVLEQSYQNIEVLVVVDGRDEATKQALSAITDRRLRQVLPEKHLGNATARNQGVQEARGEWVAFLDDDDFWLPDKLRLQLITARQAACPSPVISCRSVNVADSARHLRPRRPNHHGESISEYLFSRRSPYYDLGQLQTSTLMARRSMLLKHPFDGSILHHVDLDWVLRIGQLDDCCILFIPQEKPLTIRDISLKRQRISNSYNWRSSLSWLRHRRHLVSRRAYMAFVLVNISAVAAVHGAAGAFPILLAEALREGMPPLIYLMAFGANMIKVTAPGRKLIGKLTFWLRKLRKITHNL